MNLFPNSNDLAFDESFLNFLLKSFYTVSPGVRYAHNWHIDLIADKLRQIEEGKIKRLIINIPPRYLKSICVSVAWSAWLMGRNPNCKIMASSYSQTLSNKHSQDCRLIMQSEWYKQTFPNTKIAKGENQKFKFVTTQRGYRFATSNGGTATGEGGDFLIVDDPQNPNKIHSKKYRESTIEWFEQTFISRLNNKRTGAIVIVMQRLHEDDLCGYLIKNKRHQWDVLKLPIVHEQSIAYSLNKTKQVEISTNSFLHIDRENKNDVDNLKDELGNYNFHAQYLQSPVLNQGSMVQKSWLKYFANDKPEFYKIIQSWDTAIKAKNDHDYSVGITIGVHQHNYYILDVLRVKVEFPELITHLKDYAKKWNPQAIIVEDAASGQSLIQTLQSSFKTPIIGIKPKFDKITRFARHTMLFESGKIFIDRNANWRGSFEHELLSFPKTTHDDQIDSLSQALNYLQERSKIQIRRL